MAQQTALVIDDNSENAEMFATMIRLKHYTVVEMTSGLDAINWLRLNTAPKLILLDMIMPGIDGRQVYKAIRTQTKYANTRVILMSANSQVIDEIKRIMHTGDLVLQKPFQITELQEIIPISPQTQITI